MHKLLGGILVLSLIVPLASAGFSYTGYGPYNVFSAGNSDFRTGFYTTPNSAFVYGSEYGTGGLAFGMGFSRPTYTSYSVDWDDPNRNARSIAYGDWQLSSARVNCPDCGFGLSLAQNPATGTYAGYGYTGTYAPRPPLFGSTYGAHGHNRFMNSHGMSGMGAWNWRYPDWGRTRTFYVR